MAGVTNRPYKIGRASTLWWSVWGHTECFSAQPLLKGALRAETYRVIQLDLTAFRKELTALMTVRALLQSVGMYFSKCMRCAVYRAWGGASPHGRWWKGYTQFAVWDSCPIGPDPWTFLAQVVNLCVITYQQKGCLGNPTLGTNIGQRIRAMRTGCSSASSAPRVLSQHADVQPSIAAAPGPE